MAVPSWQDSSAHACAQRRKCATAPMSDQCAAGALNCTGVLSYGFLPCCCVVRCCCNAGATLLRCKAFSQEVYGLRFCPHSPGHLVSCGTGHIRFWKMASTFTGLKLQVCMQLFHLLAVGHARCSNVCAHRSNTHQQQQATCAHSAAVSKITLASTVEQGICVDDHVTRLMQGALGRFGAVELSDMAVFVELPDGKVLSGSEAGDLLLWEGGLIKAVINR